MLSLENNLLPLFMIYKNWNKSHKIWVNSAKKAETWHQHLTSIALEAWMFVCVWRVRGQYAWITQAHPRAMGEKEKEGCSNNLWITSPWVNIKTLCLFFIISQWHWAPGREASYALTTSHPNWSLYLNGPIFSVENCCNSEEKMTAFLFVLAAVFLTDITKASQI